MMTSAPDDDKCDHEAAVSDVICVSVPHVQDDPRDESILATVAPSVGLLSTFQSLQFCVPVLKYKPSMTIVPSGVKNVSWLILPKLPPFFFFPPIP